MMVLRFREKIHTTFYVNLLSGALMSSPIQNVGYGITNALQGLSYSSTSSVAT